MSCIRMKPVFLRAYRAGVLVLIAWFVHTQHSRMNAPQGNSLTLAQAKKYFSDAANLSAADSQNGMQRVTDAKDETLGFVAQTAPLSNNIIGYAGPTNALIVFNDRARVRFVDILRSEDTPEHVAKVGASREFSTAFKHMKMGAGEELPKIEAVSGATLTSAAVADGVMRRLGQTTPSMRFPEEIDVKEVRHLLPEARSLKASAQRPGFLEALDENGKILGLAGRTSPASDSVIGYRGPSDLLVILDAQGVKLQAIKLRKTFDTPDYVAYVTGDKYFMNLFNGMGIPKLASLDIEKDLIEGVSGATKTSWGFAESLRARAVALLGGKSKPTEHFSFASVKRADWGLLAVVISSLVMTLTKLRGNKIARWIHQAALIGYAGIFSSALLSQGLLVGWTRSGLPWRTAPVFLLLAVMSFALPLFTRRQFYCHHYCPHGALQQWLSHKLKWQLHVPQAVGRWLEKIPVLLLVFILVVVMLGKNISLNTLEPFDAWAISIAGRSAIVIAVTGLVASLFVPMSYCRYGCPTGVLLKYVRYSGEADHVGKRDVVAFGLVALAAALHFVR